MVSSATSEWEESTWGKLIELKYGKSLRDYKESDGDFPVFGTNGPIGWWTEPLCEHAGIVIGRKGAYRGVHYSDKPFFVIDTAYFVEPIIDINLKWAYYHLLRQDINNLDSGSAIPSTSREDVYQLPVKVPPRATQDKIAEVLSEFDHKINLNRQINQTLEQIAQAIFKSWFVNFEPVKAKQHLRTLGGNDDQTERAAQAIIAGAVNLDVITTATDLSILDQQLTEALSVNLAHQTDAQREQLAATASHFPDELVESEQGLIPEGWGVESLGDLLDVLETGSRPKVGVKGITEGVPSVGAENVSGVGNYNYGKEKFVPEEFFANLKRGVVESEDVLLYKDGGKPGDFRPRVSMFGLGFPYERFAINEHVFRLRSGRLGQPFLYLKISHEEVLFELRHKGGKAAIPGVNQNDVKTIRLVVPQQEVLSAFNETAKMLLNQILRNSSASLSLARVRDALLPKLLSGDLQVQTAV